jgi:hypothetical protein
MICNVFGSQPKQTTEQQGISPPFLPKPNHTTHGYTSNMQGTSFEADELEQSSG